MILCRNYHLCQRNSNYLVLVRAFNRETTNWRERAWSIDELQHFRQTARSVDKLQAEPRCRHMLDLNYPVNSSHPPPFPSVPDPLALTRRARVGLLTSENVTTYAQEQSGARPAPPEVHRPLDRPARTHWVGVSGLAGDELAGAALCAPMRRGDAKGTTWAHSIHACKLCVSIPIMHCVRGPVRCGALGWCLNITGSGNF